MGQTVNNYTNNGKTMVALNYLSSFKRTLEMPLIICEANVILNWDTKYIISFNTLAAQATTCAISDTKRYVSVVTLSTQGNVKLFDQLKWSFKKTINWNKYQTKRAPRLWNNVFYL